MTAQSVADMLMHRGLLDEGQAQDVIHDARNTGKDIVEMLELPGMPHFLRRDEVEALYAELSGHTPRDMDFYTVYAALRHAVVMSQVQRRAIAFGEAEMPEDVDDLIMHRQTLEEMLEGEYWERVLRSADAS